MIKIKKKKKKNKKKKKKKKKINNNNKIRIFNDYFYMNELIIYYCNLLELKF